MRSHRCMIDLKSDSLTFPDADIKVNFLSDGEIKKNKNLEEEALGEQKENIESMDLDADIEQVKKDSLQEQKK